MNTKNNACGDNFTRKNNKRIKEIGHLILRVKILQLHVCVHGTLCCSWCTCIQHIQQLFTNLITCLLFKRTHNNSLNVVMYVNNMHIWVPIYMIVELLSTITVTFR